MRPIKVKRRGRKERTAMKKEALGEPASMIYENFETLLGMKPELKLLEAKPHIPPNSNVSNDQIKATDDPNRPSREELANSNHETLTLEKEPIPHENEAVKQDNSNLKDASLDKTAAIQKEAEEYRNRYNLSMKLAGIKTEMGLLQDVDQFSFAEKLASERSVTEIEDTISENEDALSIIRQSRINQESQIKNASIPTSVPNYQGVSRSQATLDDIMAGL